MEIGTIVNFQQTEHTHVVIGGDPEVTFHQTPAIVTAVRKTRRLKDGSPRPVFHHPGEPPRDENNRILNISPPKGEAEWEEIEVVSLTVFYEGRIAFERAVEPFRDELGRQAGAHSYVAQGQRQPQPNRPRQTERPIETPRPGTQPRQFGPGVEPQPRSDNLPSPRPEPNRPI